MIDNGDNSQFKSEEELKKHYESLTKVNPDVADQPRDNHGRWTVEDGGDGGKKDDAAVIREPQLHAGERAALVRDSKIEKEFPKAWKVHVLSVNGNQAKVQIWEGGVGYTRNVPLKDLTRPKSK